MSEQAQQVTAIDHISDETAPVVYVQNGLKPFLQMIKDEVCGEVPDLTTKKGRDRIASLSALVSKRKAAVEKPGRDYLRRIKELPKVIEAELRQFVDEANKLRDEVRKPLTEWEQANDARIDAHNDGIRRIQVLAEELQDITAEDLSDRIQQVEAIAIGEQWQEFEPEAARAKDKALATLRATLIKRQAFEAEQAELARLRAEAEARAKADHEAAIAREAAERTQREAEQKAQAEREAAARREMALIEAAEREKRDAENQRLQLQLQAEQAERQATQAKADQAAAEQRAEQQRIESERRQAEAVERARLNEIARQEAAAAEVARQEKLREADKAHKAKINRAALEAFMAGGMPEDCAKQAVTLIAQRKIPSVSISY